jgi:predicted transcriptional regulator
MKFATLALIGTAAAVNFDTMNEDELLAQLATTLSSAQRSEAMGDGDAAVAKTAAIKNIQKSLTARILKRLDDGQPLVEVARKMKAIEGMQPQINDMERRLGIMQSVEPVLENAIKTLQKVVDVRGMGKK